MTLKHWTSETGDDGIVWLRIDKADGGANVLSGEVLTELHELIRPLATQPPKGVVIHSGKSNGFVMGADINEFTTIENPEQAYRLIRLGQQVLDQLEALPCPTVAVINGFALGGGLELARWPATTGSRSRPRNASSVCPRCSSAFIRASVAPCVPCRSLGFGPPCS
jgi:3-hydroxyacyl-CoA dehydrogenase/enoyl-CoA hydratase/3-hydroxybutyryl-CoA epimerase